ncbi:MAG: SUMF1/EgtB/PvdO family nonheme iron enzyme [Gammaproteobacteria bacterium]|nr:SUMF1/EgtB/PvdO family nonheme iron enzyme [Gammaproteobacteria bacterium]MDE0363100.1 SUMF1/EgtB/PvdO family nonheme iron enzyme [Rhodospirillaceae bacterium]
MGLKLTTIVLAVVAIALPAAYARSEDFTPGTVFQDCPVCPQMVVIPPGRYVKGSPPGEAIAEGTPERDARNETPQEPVSVDKVFAVSVTEVTRAQFADFVAEEGYDLEWQCITWDFATNQWGARDTAWTWSDPGFEQGPDHPVVCISFTDAQAYSEWLSARTGERYRLLRDDEWEYIARDRSQGARPWEDAYGPEREDACVHANVMDLDAADYLKVDAAPPDSHFFPCRDGYPLTAPVGRFPANSYGAHDMLGNVWEWVDGCMYAAPVAGESVTEDCSERLIRGGAWQAKAWYVRSAKRDWAPFFLRSARVGLRIARDLH